MYILYILLITTIVYKDSFLSIILQDFGTEFIAPISIVLLFIYIFKRRKVSLTPLSKRLILLEKILIVTNIIFITIFFIINGTLFWLDEFVPLKALKDNLYFFSAICYVILLETSIKNLSVEQVLKPFVYIQIFLAGLMTIELTQIPYALQPLHTAAVFPYTRVRLLTLEASFTAAIVLISSIMAMGYWWHIKKRKIGLITSFFLMCYLLIKSDSKMLITVFLISIIWWLFFNNKLLVFSVKKLFIKLFVGSVVFIIIFIIANNLISMYLKDISEYTSIATRGYTAFVGIIYGIIFPFGTGNGVYIQWSVLLMEKLIWIFDSISINFNLHEIYEMINSTTDEIINTKSAISEYSIRMGIIGVYLLYSFVWKLVGKFKRISNERFFILDIAGNVLMIFLVVGLPFYKDFILCVTMIIINFFNDRYEEKNQLQVKEYKHEKNWNYNC